MTIACEDRDFVEWHRGIPHAYIWGFRAPTDIQPARAALEGLLLPRYNRQPHVTVAYGGLACKEFTEPQLAEDLRRLAPLCRGAVAVHAKRWGSFTPSPMLEVSSQWVQDAHHALSVDLPQRILDPYTPHVTVGFYRVAVPLEQPLGRLADVPLPGPFTVDALELLRYDTHDVAGPLTVAGRLDLNTGCYASA